MEDVRPKLLALLVLHPEEDVRPIPERAPLLSHPAVQVIDDQVDVDLIKSSVNDVHIETEVTTRKIHTIGVTLI